MLPFRGDPFSEGAYSKRKEFAPLGFGSTLKREFAAKESKFFPFRVDSFSWEQTDPFRVDPFVSILKGKNLPK